MHIRYGFVKFVCSYCSSYNAWPNCFNNEIVSPFLIFEVYNMKKEIMKMYNDIIYIYAHYNCRQRISEVDNCLILSPI